MAGSFKKVSLLDETEEGAEGEELFANGVFAGEGAGIGGTFGAGEGAGRDAADSARVSAPGTASFLRIVSRLTLSRISQRRRTRISRATSRARERRR